MFTLLTSNLSNLEEILVPIGICVVLPCLIVFLVMWARRNEINCKTEVALKAIENGAQIDPDFFAKPNRSKNVKGRFFGFLITSLILLGFGTAMCVLSRFPSVDEPDLIIPGVVLLSVGAAFIVLYFIGRKLFASEIKSEEEKLGKKE